MQVKEIHNFTDMIRFLETFMSWEDGFQYDPGGIFQLMTALIRNLKANSIDADLRDINGYFDADEKEFLAKLSAYAQLPEED